VATIDFWTKYTVLIGLAVFIILIIKAMWTNKFNLGELDNGEIRKAIMVTFTIVYIIILPYYFFNAYMPAAENISKTNASMLVKALPTAQSQLYCTSPNLLPEVPASAFNDILRNFLWVYIVLIIFYFGSRAIDGYTEAKRIDTLKKSDAIEIIRTQYARGKIDKATLETKMQELKDPANQPPANQPPADPPPANQNR
jgi:hypothetical protein